MKLIQLGIVFLSMAMFYGCTDELDKKVNIRPFKFDGKGLKVITSSANDRANTISILYGNDLALENKVKGFPREPGELFKQVTFEQQDHEFWYGSKINGALQKVETIRVIKREDSIIYSYIVEYFNAKSVKKEIVDNYKRTQFILDQNPSVFP